MDHRRDEVQGNSNPKNGQAGSVPSVAVQGDGHTSRRSRSDRRRKFLSDRWLTQKLLSQVGNPPLRIVLWNGAEVVPPGAPPLPRVVIHDFKTLVKILANPDLAFGDAYTDKRIEVEGDLIQFLETVFRATPPSAGSFLKRQFLRWLQRPYANTLAGSKDNIHHHYDLSNDFYKLWLDDEMVYTCAYFPTPSASLEEAQRAKMDHVCRKVRLQSGQNVIEAGCGWGGLARHIARHYGAKVRAFNISHEQIVYARERARAEGISHLVEYIEDDYRNITGSCDVFVSVGMLEHVGVENYPTLGEVIHRCLKPTGLGLIHSIGKHQPSPTNRWLENRIFPGSYMPSLGEIMEVFEPRGFSILDVENLRLHYAKTLEHWLSRFDQQGNQVTTMFDERFVRTWRLYLASSLAGFNTGFIQLFQVVFAPFASNEVPWTRDYMYQGDRGAK